MLFAVLAGIVIGMASAAKYRVTVSSTTWDAAKSNTDHLTIVYGSGEADPDKAACVIYADWNRPNNMASCYFVTEDPVDAFSVSIDVSDTFGINTLQVFSYNQNRALFSHSRPSSGTGSVYCTLNLNNAYAGAQVFLLSLFDASGVKDNIASTYRVELEVGQYSAAASSSDNVYVEFYDDTETKRAGCTIKSGADGAFKIGELQACEFTTTYSVAGFVTRATAIGDALSISRLMIYDVTDSMNSVRLMEWFPGNVVNWDNYISYYTLLNGHSSYFRWDVVTY